jgi:hypothetical protein
MTAKLNLVFPSENTQFFEQIGLTKPRLKRLAFGTHFAL